MLEPLLKRAPNAHLRGGAIPVFSPRREEDRAADAYDKDSAVADYYCAVAFGHQSGVWDLAESELGRGAPEGLYRTVSSAVFELGCRKTSGVLLDLGCGVGRTVRDCAPVMTGWRFVAMDFSYRMCERAFDVLSGGAAIPLPALARRGFLTATLPAWEPVSNACVAQGSALDLPFCDGAFDAVSATLLLDRLADPVMGLNEMARVVVPGGTLILTTPLNFREAGQWLSLGEVKDLTTLLRNCGFELRTAFDGLPYREIKDRRGSSEEWQVAVFVAERTTT